MQDVATLFAAPATFAAEAKKGALVLDTRPATEFTQGFVPGSLFIGAGPGFNDWAKELVGEDAVILLVPVADEEQNSVEALGAAGREVKYVLKGGMDAWKQEGLPVDMIVDVEPDELAMDIPHDPHLVVLDVRTEEEFNGGHVKKAVNIPLPELTDPANIAGFEENQNIYVHCKSGYRSVIATSLFKRQGMHNIRNVLGGFEKIKGTEGIERTSAEKKNSPD